MNRHVMLLSLALVVVFSQGCAARIGISNLPSVSVFNDTECDVVVDIKCNAPVRILDSTSSVIVLGGAKRIREDGVVSWGDPQLLFDPKESVRLQVEQRNMDVQLVVIASPEDSQCYGGLTRFVSFRHPTGNSNSYYRRLNKQKPPVVIRSIRRHQR